MQDFVSEGALAWEPEEYYVMKLKKPPIRSEKDTY